MAKCVCGGDTTFRYCCGYYYQRRSGIVYFYQSSSSSSVVVVSLFGGSTRISADNVSSLYHCVVVFLDSPPVCPGDTDSDSMWTGRVTLSRSHLLLFEVVALKVHDIYSSRDMRELQEL